MGNISNVIPVPTSIESNFFRLWLEFLKPLHKLTDRETEVLAAFLKHRYTLSKVINDDELLDKVVMSEDTKRAIRKECNITQTYFQVIMTKYKKNKIIIDGKVNPKLIPKISEGAKNLHLLVTFSL